MNVIDSVVCLGLTLLRDLVLTGHYNYYIFCFPVLRKGLLYSDFFVLIFCVTHVVLPWDLVFDLPILSVKTFDPLTLSLTLKLVVNTVPILRTQTIDTTPILSFTGTRIFYVRLLSVSFTILYTLAVILPYLF